jgi:hypothetical protein
MNTKDIISLCIVVATAGTAVTVTLSADNPALPLSSQAHDATRVDTVTTSSLPSSLRAILEQPPPVLRATSNPSAHDVSAHRTHPRDASTPRTSTSSAQRAHAARARQSHAARARPARPTRVARPQTAPALVVNRPPAPAAPRVADRIAPQPPPPTVPHRTTPPRPPRTTSFDDSG